MSAIAGIINFNGAPVHPALIERMTANLSHRGRDGHHVLVTGNAAFGHCLLRTTPQSFEESQPLANGDRSLILVMDGRIDNWDELRGEMLARGARLRSSSDAELVLHAYEIWGESCIDHLDGDFAFLIWDERQQKAFCARDHLGHKPLVYHWSGTTLAFASELRAILDLPWVREAPDEGMLAEVLADDWLTSDATLWAGIKRLPPAHTMRVGAAGCTVRRYWSPEEAPILRYASDEDYFEHYRAVFGESVRRLSRSHKPLACGMSGGLDSSGIFCMAAKLEKAGHLLAPGFEGYHCSFPNHPESYELNYVEAVARDLSKPIHILEPATSDWAALAEQAKFYRDFPGYPSNSWASETYERAGKNGSVVLLTGNYGDHFLGGSRNHYTEELAQLNWGNVLRCFRHDTKTYGLAGATGLLVRAGLLPFTPEVIKRLLRPFAADRDPRLERGDWLSPEMQQRLALRRRLSPPMLAIRPGDRARTQLLHALTYPFDNWANELGERLASAHGFELRHPYATRSFVEFAFQTPERLRSLGRQGKFIHHQALSHILPRETRERTSKADAGSMMADFIRPLETYLSTDLPERHPSWVQSSGIKELLDAHKSTQGGGWQSWALLNAVGCGLAFDHIEG